MRLWYHRVMQGLSIKNIVIFFLAVILFTLLYLSQRERLEQYDRWYACMNDDWNYKRCNLKIYGRGVNI